MIRKTLLEVSCDADVQDAPEACQDVNVVELHRQERTSECFGAHVFYSQWRATQPTPIPRYARDDTYGSGKPSRSSRSLACSEASTSIFPRLRGERSKALPKKSNGFLYG